MPKSLVSQLYLWVSISVNIDVDGAVWSGTNFLLQNKEGQIKKNYSLPIVSFSQRLKLHS